MTHPSPHFNRSPRQHSAPVSRRAATRLPVNRRATRTGKGQSPFVPPEDWYEPQDSRSPDYRIVVQDPGAGYQHVVTPQQIRRRLAQLPSEMLRQLEFVQLSRMTRKKKTCPCYGMQWGPTLYLYPIENGLVEYFARPPRPAERNEAQMFGGCWKHRDGAWQLHWTKSALEDFYLNNILIHELGHLLDNRNRSYVDRERYAEWFAIEYGYKRSSRTPRKRKHRHGTR